MNKMYLSSSVEYINYGKTNIINYSICDTLEEALSKGKYYIKEYLCNKLDKDIDELSEDQYNKFMEDPNLLYSINISVFSTNRISFNNAKDLMDYFNNNINKISNENLYDFLLTLVDCDSRHYDYNGNFKVNTIFARSFLIEPPCAYDLLFTEESCMNGVYEFWFR